jgi:transcriptional regulator with XRE-family HTH domain
MESSFLSSPTKCRGIGARITQVRSRITQGKFADSLGIHKNTLIRYEKEARLPDSEVLTLIHQIYGVDLAWLLTGQSKRSATPEDLSYDYVPIALCCPSPHEINTGPISIKRSWAISELQVEPEDLLLFCIEGESMKPTLFPDDIVLANLKDTIVRDGLYVVKIENALMIKRLQRLSKDLIQVSSDNPAYESWIINLSEFTQRLVIQGRVIRVSRRV